MTHTYKKENTQKKQQTQKPKKTQQQKQQIAFYQKKAFQTRTRLSPKKGETYLTATFFRFVSRNMINVFFFRGTVRPLPFFLTYITTTNNITNKVNEALSAVGPINTSSR